MCGPNTQKALVVQSCPTLCDPMDCSLVAHQAPLSMGFSRQEYWSGLPFPSPGDLPNPGIKPGSLALQADSLLRTQGSVNPVSPTDARKTQDAFPPKSRTSLPGPLTWLTLRLLGRPQPPFDPGGWGQSLGMPRGFPGKTGCPDPTTRTLSLSSAPCAAGALLRLRVYADTGLP